MKNKLLSLLLVSLLAACAGHAPMEEPEEQAIALPTKNGIRILLGYHRLLEDASQADLGKELAALGAAPAGAETEVRKAIVLGFMRDSGKLARARTILAGVLLMDDSEALALRPLVEWMISNNVELRRVALLGERQAQQLKEQLKEAQRRSDQLNEKLEAMKRIESSQPASPIEIAPVK
jgi:hypothetical protein